MGRESLMPIDQALAIMGLTELPKSVEEYRKIRNHKLMTINAETHGELMSDTLLMISFNSASESIRHHIKNPTPPPRPPPSQDQGEEEPFNPFDPRTWPQTQETREYITWKWVNAKKGRNTGLYQVGIAKASQLRWPNDTDQWPVKIKLLDDNTTTIYTMTEHNKRYAVYERRKVSGSNKGPIHVLNDAGTTMSRH
jgi:acyl-CoA thioesterase